LGTVARKFVPGVHWKSRVLFYRSLDHNRTRERCKKLGQNPLPNEEQTFFGWPSFPAELRFFASEFVNLQELRHQSDYDPDVKFTNQEAQEAVDAARTAIANLRAAQEESLIPFLSYILFGLRR
jgi:selenocysteine lyase/cysteine desulfurase